MRNLRISVIIGALAVVGAAACGSTTPKTSAEQASLEQRANGAGSQMRARAPGIGSILASSAGYAVFPDVGKGGLIIGGAAGHGVLYENGHVTGFVRISQG